MSNNKAFKVKNGLELGAISDTITDTAVDVFVYDTAKDSDGGAWRHRTQATSWYNEDLNTATRGSRKEFPAVAVIVAESNKVTIYDGDDPALPMWMVFNAGSTAYIGNNIAGRNCTSTTALNAQVSVGRTSDGVFNINLIKDNCVRNSVSTASIVYINPVSQRNASGTFFVTSDNIVNATVNDVAMTVLPNAPIDAATGLPVPTIAVATDGGVSVIKDDGTVVDPITSETYAEVSFDTYGTLYSLHGRSTNSVVVVHKTYISDGQTADHLYYETGTTGNNYLKFVGTQGVHIANGDNFYVGSLSADAGGLSHIAEDKSYSTQDVGMIAYTTSDYATGWMNGDIKLATLSDTDATNVTGSELVTNGTFDTDTSGWTALNSATLSVVSGALRISQTTVDYARAEQAITVEVGKTYTVSVELKGGTGAARVILGTTSEGTQYYIGSVLTAAQTISTTFTATTTTAYLTLTNDTTTDNTYYDFDNISVRLAEEDRSVNGNGLQVFGTVTKSAVSSGADLVAYTDFADGEYLFQPPNADMDFGTGDFCVMLWHYHEDATFDDTIYFLKSASSNAGVQVGAAGSDASYLWVIGQNLRARTSANTVITQAWTHLCYVRRNGVAETWVNGVRQATSADAADLDSNQGIYIPSDTAAGDGNDLLSLLRVSATAPSPEQILKIYNDEKPLFQENAQATLYGDSDAVTALAYDDSNGILSVGTSAGRSDFQGLRRVNNTTNAVGAAISASNGLIVEE